MSALTLSIPYFTQVRGSGAARLNGKAGESLPKEAGSGQLRVRDLRLIHTVLDDSELDPLKTIFPGIVATRHLYNGDPSAGKVVLTYDPSKGVPWNGDLDLTVRPHGGGDVIYQGQAFVRSIKVSMTRTVTTVEVNIRCLHVDPVQHRISAALGEYVTYEFDKSVVRAAPAAPGQAGLPFSGSKADEIQPGNIVVYSDDAGDGSGLVRMAGPDVILITGTMDERGSDAVEIHRDAVVIAHVLCGPQGGDPSLSMRRMADAAAALEISLLSDHVLRAIFEASARPEDPLQALPEGWPLTPEIRKRAIEIAASDAGLDADVPMDEDDALPPEPGEGSEE